MAQELLEKYHAPHCAKAGTGGSRNLRKKGNSSLKLIAGVDIGNSTTEVCIGSDRREWQISRFLSSASTDDHGYQGNACRMFTESRQLLQEAMERDRHEHCEAA